VINLPLFLAVAVSAQVVPVQAAPSALSVHVAATAMLSDCSFSAGIALPFQAPYLHLDGTPALIAPGVRMPYEPVAEVRLPSAEGLMLEEGRVKIAVRGLRAPKLDGLFDGTVRP
jgi:hypothetical protein